jgi:hypothetical protein
MYPGHQPSYADPELSRLHYQALLSQLDAKGVVLAGFELGNEINCLQRPLPSGRGGFALRQETRKTLDQEEVPPARAKRAIPATPAARSCNSNRVVVRR